MLSVPADTRATLKRLPGSIENPSLLFQKLLIHTDHGGAKAKENALHRLVDSRPLRDYGKRNHAFVDQLQSTYGDRVRTVYGELQSRLAINLADGLIENAGIFLDRNYGAPMIPASAVKGCCNHAAYWLEEEGALAEGTREWIFGPDPGVEPHNKGGVLFLPAQPVHQIQIETDVVTPHPRPNGREKAPVPNQFPVVAPGGIFAFSYVIGNRYDYAPPGSLQDLHTTLDTILARAFAEGMGAKTGAGYGWFARATDYEQQLAAAKEQERKRMEEKAEAQRQREEAERRKKEEEEKREQAKIDQQKREAINKAEREQREQEEAQRLQSLPPLERFREELTKKSKEELLSFFRKLEEQDADHQRVALEVLKEKGSSTQNKVKKDRRAKPVLQRVTQALNFEL